MLGNQDGVSFAVRGTDVFKLSTLALINSVVVGLLFILKKKNALFKLYMINNSSIF